MKGSHKADKFDAVLAKEYISSNESAIVDPVEVEWTWNRSSGKGNFVITYGALYVFKGQKRQAKIHLLRISGIRISERELTITFSDDNSEESSIIIKSDKVDTISMNIIKCFKELTYKVKIPPRIAIEGYKAADLNKLVITDRPEGLLAIRMMFFLHYYAQEKKSVHIPSFFQKWDGGPYVQLSDNGMKHFLSHISMHSCMALAHAISWETLNAIVFDQFISTGSQSNFFNAMLRCILENARSIGSFVFKNYNGTAVPKFDKERPLKPASINRWEFEFCSNSMISDWMSFTQVLPDGCIDSLRLSCIHDFEIELLCRAAGRAKAFEKMKSLDVKWSIPLHPEEIPRLIQLTPALEKITLCGKEDAREILKILTDLEIPLRRIHLHSMDFATQFTPDMTLPPTLLEINVSGCRFMSGLVLKSFFNYLTSKALKTPITVVAANISRRDTKIYTHLKTIDFEKRYPNIGELDWSGNAIPASESQWLFALLCTQKRLKLLRMKDIVTCESGKEDVIMQHIIQLGVSLPLFGLDISFKHTEISNAKFVEFVQALSVVKSLRRLDLSGTSHAGIDAFMALNETIQRLDNLVELGFDGFNLDESNQKALFAFLTAIKNHRSLKTFDYPEKSLKSVGFDESKTSQVNTQLLGWMKRQSRLTTGNRRVEYQLRQMRMGDQDVDDSPDLFKKAAEMGNYIEE